jgi:opacity protein-like surface antigen
LAAFVILFLAFGAATASAQAGLYFGGFLGYSAQKPSFKDVTFTTDTTLVSGLRAGLRFLMLAVEVSYFSAMHNVAMSDFLLFNWDGRTNNYSYIGLNLKYIMSIAFLQPYLTAGYGYYTVDIRDIDKDNEGGYNFGAGVEIRLGKRLGIVADGRWHHVRVNIDKVDVGFGNFILTGGLNFHF